MSFLTQLNRSSYPEVDRLIRSHVFSKSAKVDALLQRPLTEPQDGSPYVLVEGYWIARGTEPIPADQSSDYILTEAVRANLRDLARVVSAGYAVLLLSSNSASCIYQ